MSTFRRIWAEAIRAGQVMALDPELGDQPFAELVARYPEDGMVMYERGEAHEYLGRLDRAEADYSRAEQLLRAPHWQAVARRSASRVQLRLRSGTAETSGGSIQWRAFHAVHGTPEAPHSTRVRALSALARLDSEPESAIADLRGCLEELIAHIPDAMAGMPANAKLEAKIRMLGMRRDAPEEVLAAMQLLRAKGNIGAHGRRQLGDRDAELAAQAFVRILAWFSTRMPKSSRRRAGEGPSGKEGSVDNTAE